jgi:hypothetical protein
MWVKLDDHFVDHPKIISIGPIAGWLFVASLCYANRLLTDGFIPENQVPRLLSTNGHGREIQKLTAKLCEAGLWKAVTIKGAKGFQIHDFLDYQPSRKEILSSREWNARRQALYRNGDLLSVIRNRDKDHCRYCGCEVNWKDRRGSVGGTYDHVAPRGPETLANLVVACRGCNSMKGQKTLAEAGMTLRPEPK